MTKPEIICTPGEWEALFERADRERERTREAAVRALAEHAVLDFYDDVRRSEGHDYGAGQRWRELVRVEREANRALEAFRLNHRERFPQPLDDATLRAAARRLLVPRADRIERERENRQIVTGQRGHTRAALATLRAIDRTLDYFGTAL